MYSVYKHTCPNDKVYIGITSIEPKLRWNYGNGYNHNKHFKSAIIKYGWNNIKHEILFEGLTKKEAEQKEIELISAYKSNQRKFGYNVSSGGFARNGCKHSEETKNKISEKCKGKGHPQSEHAKKLLSEQRSGIGNPMYGKTLTKEHKRKLSESHKGKLIGRYLGSKSAKAKEVEQYTIDGGKIKSYGAFTEAQRETGIHYTSIVKACTGKQKTAGGYIWRYSNVG